MSSILQPRFLKLGACYFEKIRRLLNMPDHPSFERWRYFGAEMRGVRTSG
jgi:hypothetical protein